MDGAPATLCSDGTLSRHAADGTVAKTPSWIRPGTLAESLPNRKLGIVDRSTLRVLLNDLQNNSIFSPAFLAPEFVQANQQSVASMVEAEKKRASTDPPLGRPVLAMDTASDKSGWYVLVYPYNVTTGPAVVKLDSNGNILGRYRCRLPRPGMSSVHKIEVEKGDLLLVSPVGDVVRYKL
jgi:hypothetical protein